MFIFFNSDSLSRFVFSNISHNIHKKFGILDLKKWKNKYIMRALKHVYCKLLLLKTDPVNIFKTKQAFKRGNFLV